MKKCLLFLAGILSLTIAVILFPTTAMAAGESYPVTVTVEKTGTLEQTVKAALASGKNVGDITSLTIITEDGVYINKADCDWLKNNLRCKATSTETTAPGNLERLDISQADFVDDSKKQSGENCGLTTNAIYYHRIPFEAFRGMGLKEVLPFSGDGASTAPTKFTEIGDWAFRGNELTSKLHIPSNITYLSGFAENTSLVVDLSKGQIPDTVTEIGDRAFSQCWAMNGDIVIPDSVTKIHESAFYYAMRTAESGEDYNHTDTTKNGTLTLSQNLIYIGAQAFIGDSALKVENLTIPGSVTSIGSGAFALCSSMTGTLDLNNVQMLESGSDFNYGVFRGTGFSKIDFSNVREIGDGAFAAMPNLTTLTLESDSVKTIGDQAFADNTNLTSVKIDCPNCTSVGTSIFNKDTAVTSYELNWKGNLENSLCGAATALETVKIGKDITGLGTYVFNHDSSEDAKESFIAVDLTEAKSLTHEMLKEYSFKQVATTGIVYVNNNNLITKATGGALSETGNAGYINSNFQAAHAIIAVTNGGTFPEGTEFTSGELATPIRNGYKFEGWYPQDGSNDNNWGDSVKTPESGKIYYAKWEESDDYSISEEGETIFLDEQSYGYTTAPSKTLTVNGPDTNALISKTESTNPAFNVTLIEESSNLTVTITAATGLDVGTYTGTVYIYTGDGATHWVDVSLTVSPATPTLTLSPSSATVNSNTGTTSFTYTYTGDGAISVSSSDPSVATATLNGNIITVNILKAGSAKIAVNAAASKNYTEAKAEYALTVTPYIAEEPKPSEPPYTGDYNYPVTIGKTEHGTVTIAKEDQWANDGEKITVTVTPDDAYMLDKLVIKDKAGNELQVKDNGDGTYTFTMPEGAVTITATFVDDPDWVEPEPEPEPSTDVTDIFNDVTPGAWYVDVVQYAYDHGLMTGTSATTFEPDINTSRAMIVSILHRLEGSPSVGTCDFSDVASGAWYADPVAWAAENGIVAGFEDGTFGPNDPITREQMASILYRYAEYKGIDTSVRADLSAYSDQPSAWAQDVMEWANAEGLISGTTATILDPQGTATRAQVAAMLQRFIENVL